MKKSISYFVAFVVLLSLQFGQLFAQQEQKKGAVLAFEKEREDLGTMFIDELKQTNLEIKFTNEGDQPLVISQVRGCCGTRIVDYPRTPVLPGEEGTINISYRLANRAHRVSRTVTVTSNNAEGSNVVYRLVGEVVDRAQQPLNMNREGAMIPTANPGRR